MNIVCVGDCGVDDYIPTGERLPGGITTNFALRARGCFARRDTIQIIAPLGDDAAANIVRERLSGSDIVCHFNVLPGSTPVQSIEIDASGERKFVGYDGGVIGNFRIEGGDIERVENADLVVAPVFEQNKAAFASLMSVSRHGMTAVDFADFAEHADFDFLGSVIRQIDIGFFGLQSTQTEIIGRLHELSLTANMVFVVTLGADGSRAFQNGRNYDCPAQAVQRVVDTTGAGDAFCAGFLSQYCQTAMVAPALSRGAEMAAAAVQRHGAN